ncbi:MAG: hypothetical protein FJ344_06770 [Sphingomonadales bacterium]|nr:hypothetical protein [Sphingomonadales bacterium]
MNWSLFDFIIAFILFALLFLGVRGVLRTVRTPWKRRIALLVVLILFALIWGELAVGLFGTPFAGN